MRVYMVTQADLDHSNVFVCETEQEISDWLENCDEGESYHVQVSNMDEKEFNNLPEFDEF